jgi:DNA-directed RNA polymerase subunit RPC12/RpoP
MRGYACSNCGAKAKEKLQPPNVSKKLCTVCGKSLVVKMNDKKTEVIVYFDTSSKRKKVCG